MARIDDGFSTTIQVAGVQFPTFSMWEKEPQPPGMDGGGPVDTTTMRNTTWRTRNPKHLITLTELNCVSAYDPFIYTDLLNILNDNMLYTVTFPNGDQVQFYGWLDKAIINPHREGEQPTMNVTIVPSNQDDNGNEAAPFYIPA